MVKIICPTLNIDMAASESAVAEIIPKLENRPDPFLILGKDELTYIQALWTKNGYDLEYQEGSILKHYRLSELTNKENVIWALQSYFQGQLYWKTKFKFEKKEIATLSFKLGHQMGYFAGRFWRFLKGN